MQRRRENGEMKLRKSGVQYGERAHHIDEVSGRREREYLWNEAGCTRERRWKSRSSSLRQDSLKWSRNRSLRYRCRTGVCTRGMRAIHDSNHKGSVLKPAVPHLDGMCICWFIMEAKLILPLKCYKKANPMMPCNNIQRWSTKQGDNIDTIRYYRNWIKDHCTRCVRAMWFCMSFKVLHHKVKIQNRAPSCRSKQTVLKSKLAKHVPASSLEYTLHRKLITG